MELPLDLEAVKRLIGDQAITILALQARIAALEAPQPDKPQTGETDTG